MRQNHLAKPGKILVMALENPQKKFRLFVSCRATPAPTGQVRGTWCVGPRTAPCTRRARG